MSSSHKFHSSIKNAVDPVDLDNYEAMDIMRGEEVESIAVVDACFQGRPMLLVLPGSHNKFVYVNEDRKIEGCLTSVSGELLASITNDTILSKSVGHKFVNENSYDKKWLLEGYKNARKTGLGRACFSARILNLFMEKNPEKIANYILGASLQGDIMAICNSDAIKVGKDTDIVVCGKNPLKQALVDIFEFEGCFGKVQSYMPPEKTTASAIGAYLIAEKSNIL